MSGNSRYQSDGDLGFQIAPMLDVIFVIMLFFMTLAGDKKVETQLKMTLPSTEQSQDSTQDTPMEESINIDDSGNIGPVSDSVPNHVAFWDGHATAPKAVRFTAPTTVTTEYTVIWPAAPGTSGQILSVASVAGTTLTLQWSTP